MTDIVAFLTARVAEDATEAEAATSGPWHVDQMPHRTNVVVPHEGLDRIGTAGQRMDVPIFTGQTANRGRLQWEADATHIARHDPARALREVATKQTLIRIYQCAVTELGNHRKAAERASLLGDRGTEAFTAEVHRAEAAEREWRDVLQIHAAVYADHPDYDPAWRTE